MTRPFRFTSTPYQSLSGALLSQLVLSVQPSPPGRAVERLKRRTIRLHASLRAGITGQDDA